jgi:hypothetical protein
MNITREQAFAFAEALVGFIDLSEGNGYPKSPHARTAIENILGLNRVPMSSWLWSKCIGVKSVDDLSINGLGELLIAVGQHLCNKNEK